jgi:succinoglycan biosynthesis protein ExoW
MPTSASVTATRAANSPGAAGIDQSLPAAARIAVLIPYFQVEAGLLQRALRSVAAQEFAPVQVVVVDDGSPRPAAEEITPELRAVLPGLTLIRQANGGAAAARNTGLDALNDEVSAIALLDSDDYWETSHLRYAATALALGADFFFSNSRVEGETEDHFHQHPQRDLLCAAQRLRGVPGIARWSEKIPALLGVSGAGPVFRTATVVFRRTVMPGLRFPTEFRRMGEDQAAYWQLLTRSSVIMFCSEPTLVYGSGGLGTWKNSTFGSPAHLVRLADEIRYARYVLRNQPVSRRDRPSMRSQIRARRYEALQSTLHLLRRRRQVLPGVVYLLRVDPLCAASWCLGVPKLLCRKLRARFAATR